MLHILCMLTLLPTLASTNGPVTEDQREPLDITILILNQHHKLHEEKALKLQTSLYTQAKDISHLSMNVEIGSLSFPHLPYWTFFPLLEQFQNTKSDWIVIVDEYVSINLHNLLILFKEKSDLPMLGRSLSDAAATGIHHYAGPEEVPHYPDIRAGIVITGEALKSAAFKYDSVAAARDNQFSIDPAYEWSRWLLERVGLRLQDASSRLCVLDEQRGDQDCAVLAGPPHVCQPNASASSASVGLHVAVKTFSGNHKERLPVIQSTWLPQAHTYTLYSDRTDPSYGTVYSGVPNTERGHCAKTLSLLHLSLEKPDWKWLLVADDDTLISLPRVSAMLSCYSSSSALALGEVYGYRASKHQLLPYQTGGSGMIYSRAMVSALTSSPWCTCRSPDEPDDMFLGMCLNRLGHTILHRPDMHQNTPGSYAAGRLHGSSPISFHGFWLIDPRLEYKRWLHQPLSQRAHQHDDL